MFPEWTRAVTSSIIIICDSRQLYITDITRTLKLHLTVCEEHQRNKNKKLCCPLHVKSLYRWMYEKRKCQWRDEPKRCWTGERKESGSSWYFKVSESLWQWLVYDADVKHHIQWGLCPRPRPGQWENCPLLVGRPIHLSVRPCHPLCTKNSCVLKISWVNALENWLAFLVDEAS